MKILRFIGIPSLHVSRHDLGRLLLKGETNEKPENVN